MLSVGCAITALVTIITQPSLSAPADIVLPAIADGIVGGGLVRPHYVSLLGPNAGKNAEGPCLANGDQVVRIYEEATGELVEAAHVVRDIDGGDDHKLVALCPFPDGSLWAATCGHNVDNTVYLSFRDPDGDWTDSTLTFSSTVTYCSLWRDVRGDLLLWVRVGTNNWEYRRRVSGAWGAAVRFIQEGAQSYFYGRYNFDDDTVYGFISVLDTNPEYGKLKPVRMDAATGTFYHNAGAVLAIPFASADVADLAEPAAGRSLTATLSCHCGGALIVSRNESDANDTTISVWTRVEDGEFTDPDDWVMTHPVVYNAGAQIAYGANSSLPGFCWEEGPHDGYVFYGVRKIDVTNAIVGTGTQAMWCLEKWSSDDAETWTSEVLLKRARRGASAGPVTCRPVSAFGAGVRTPLMLSRMDNYTDYANLTDPRVEYCAPWRGRNCFNLETEVAAWIDRLPEAPSDLITAQVNAMVMDLNDEGIGARTGGLIIIPTETHEQRKTALFSSTAYATPVNASGVTVEGTFTPRSWFNAVSDGHAYDINVIPGSAESKMTNQFNGIGWGIASDAQHNTFFGGTQQFAMNSRNTTNQCTRRNAHATGPSAITGTSPYRGTYMLRRVLTTEFRTYQGNDATSSLASNTSEALSATQRLFLGTNNNGSNLPGTFANKSIAWNWWGQHPVNITDNPKWDSALGANLNLMLAEAA
jgi:hypothetical protein